MHMSNELLAKCQKYGITGGVKEFLENVEIHYNTAIELEQEQENIGTVCEWIESNTNIEEFKDLSEEQKFFFGLGVLATELGNDY